MLLKQFSSDKTLLTIGVQDRQNCLSMFSNIYLYVIVIMRFNLQLNPDVNVFQRKFVNEVRRCEEMDRKLSMSFIVCFVCVCV